MTDYLNKLIPLPAGTDCGLSGAKGAEYLSVHVYYYRDGKRGMKLSISRCLKSEGFTQTAIRHPTGKLFHLESMKRQNNKTGDAWAARVSANIYAIKDIAMASDTPDWWAVLDVLDVATVSA